MIIELPWRHPPLTREEQNLLFMLTVDDDTEEAPWMVMGDRQLRAATALYWALRNYVREQGLGWYVASMLPIEYRWPGVPRKKQVAPDVLVAPVADRPRQSYDVDEEGVFPPFVLEVVSPSSTARDQVEKLAIYELVGTQEYVLFTPGDATAPLAGYRRGAGGTLGPWPLEDGRLWCATLELWLEVREDLLQATTRDGQILRTPEQEASARHEEATARQAEAEARHRAEREVERLRAELDRLRGQST